MMKIGDVIKQLREEYNLSQTELAKRLNVGRSTIAMWENNDRVPSEDKKEEIADFFNIDMNYLYGKTDIKNSYIEQISQSFMCSIEEQEHIKKYRSLDTHGKELVDMVLNKEYHRPKEFVQLMPPIIVPYYGEVASAGTGQFVFDDIPPEMIEIENCMENMHVNFAIGVNGDSMEPTYSDGDTLLVKKQESINVGEIGIFMVDGEAFVKELGNGVLISHNKDYEDKKINENTICLGKVIGKHIKGCLHRYMGGES